MKRYTIGILFSESLSDVVLIEKQKPEWQKGLLNFPGGKIEEGETPEECVAREFREECGIAIPAKHWKHIGRINNEGNYQVEVLTCICPLQFPAIVTMTDEEVDWYKVIPENIITNIIWLLEFARNIHKQGANDLLTFGIFEYKYPV